MAIIYTNSAVLSNFRLDQHRTALAWSAPVDTRVFAQGDSMIICPMVRYRLQLWTSPCEDVLDPG